jgi:hypothetical protein
MGEMPGTLAEGKEFCWRAVVNTVMNMCVLWNAGNLVGRGGTVSLSRTLVQAAS